MGNYLGSKLLLLVALIYTASLFLYLTYFFKPKILKQGMYAFFVLLFGATLHIFVIVLRTVDAQHAPFQTLYESLSWFAFFAVACLLIFEWRSKVRLPGPFVIIIAISACLYALFGQSDQIKPLPPALQSGWFIWHVALAFGSYAAFVNAFAVEISFLFIRNGSRYNLNHSDKQVFHRLAYKLILFGFPLLTFGIVSGAFWAQKAWGTYWGWDPKETWALITWSVYVLYLHAKVTPGWTRGKASLLNVLGFVCMILTFVGVNWLSKLLSIPSLHVY